MCYNAFTEKARIKQIASKDIKVYKICTVTKHTVISYYYGCAYVPLEITHVIGITFTEENGFTFVAGGYHSYKNCKWHSYSTHKYVYAIVEDTYQAFHSIMQPVVIAEFIIPKGVTYYENNNGEIVSEQVMFTGIIHEPLIHEDNSVESIKINLNEENRTISTEAGK